MCYDDKRQLQWCGSTHYFGVPRRPGGRPILSANGEKRQNIGIQVHVRLPRPPRLQVDNRWVLTDSCTSCSTSTHFTVVALRITRGPPRSQTNVRYFATELLLTHMANDVHNVVRRCRSCASNRGTIYSHHKHMQLFPANGPIEFVSIDILGPLPKTTKGNQFVLVMKDR